MTVRRSRLAPLALLSAAVLFLSSCSEDATDQMSSDFNTAVDGMLPNLWVTLTQVAIFIAVAVTIYFLAYKPVKRILTKRQDYVVKNIKDSESQKANADVYYDQAKKTVVTAQKQALDIVAQARLQAEQNTEKAQKDLSDSIEKQKEQAHKDILDERERVLKGAYNQVLDTALTASKTILGREVDANDSKKIVDQFIQDMDDGSK